MYLQLQLADIVHGQEMKMKSRWIGINIRR